MSLNEEYKKLDKERLEDAKKAKEHYESVNLPGDRTFEVQTDAVRDRIAKMKIEKAKPNHDEK
jgi:hypothetical protein